MANFIRNLVADIINETIKDNNLKLADGADPPIVELAPIADVFGDVINNWIEIIGTAFWSAWPGKTTSTIAEAGGLQTFTSGTLPTSIGNRHDTSFSDMDVWDYWSTTNPAAFGSALVNFAAWRSQDNFVQCLYNARIAGGNFINVHKVINGAFTLLAQTNIGTQPDIWIRIERVASTQTFTFYYATTDPFVGVWTQLWTGVINDAIHFNNGHLLYPINIMYSNDAAWVSVCDDGLGQIVGSEERYWPDDPICNIIDSSAGAVQYAYDAGAGNLWALTGASSTLSEPGTSTVKFKIGWSDDGAAVTWVDGSWRTITEMNANAVEGDYNGHRYLHVKVQFHSTGADKPSLTDFTVSTPEPSPSAEYNLDEVVNDLDAIPLT